MGKLNSSAVVKELLDRQEVYHELARQIEGKLANLRIEGRATRDCILSSRLEAAKAEGAIEALELVLVLLGDKGIH